MCVARSRASEGSEAVTARRGSSTRATTRSGRVEYDTEDEMLTAAHKAGCVVVATPKAFTERTDYRIGPDPRTDGGIE